MNLLAIGAAYGVLVAIFQWGWFADAVGIGRPGPIESFAPMMLFAILFGLSMDYEVFLLSRVRENYVKGDSNSEAIARGVAQTAKVITAAAAIMVAVFMSFALSEGRTIKLFGLGLATAIFLDATIVRLVLVPATMGLLGDLNWWFPRWLDRLLPKLQIEGSRDAGPVERPAPPAIETTEPAETSPSAPPSAPPSPAPPLVAASPVPAAAAVDARPPMRAAEPAARMPRRDYMNGGRRIGVDYMR
jgi:RND superfamily putative drug exporter